MGEGSLSGWTEGILFVITFITVLGIVVTGFNSLYSKDNQLGLGTNTTAQSYIDYQDSAGSQIIGGEADFDTASGLTVRSSWGVVKGAFNIVGSFLTGGFVEEVFNMMSLGEAGATWAKFIRIIWVLSLIFAILYILFKVNA